MIAPSTTYMRNNGGFTLIEIIVTIIISAVLAVILAQVMSNRTWRSYEPLQYMNRGLALREVMEDITSDHRALLQSDPSPLQTLQSNIEAGAYWATKPFGDSIQTSSNYCLNLEQDGHIDAGESDKASCNVGDTILKVTLAYGPQTLTALFTQ